MLTILAFISYIIKYNFVLYVMHITPHLHVVQDFSNFEILKTILNFWIFEFHIFYIVSFFWTWVVGYYHLNSFTIKIMLLQ
jgi:hypothetical protein